MPYFKFTTEKNDGVIDYTAFTTKTKAAMSFYDKQNFDKIFRSLYIIGEDVDQFMNVGYSVGGNSQVNCPNAIELCAATALIDFLKSAPAAFEIKLMTRDEENGLMLVTQDMLNKAGQSNSYENLAGLLKFAVMYTKYYYHHLKEGRANGAWLDKYKGITPEEMDFLYEYSMLFINWMRAVHRQTDANGYLTPNVNNAIRLFRFSLDYDILYNGAPVTKTLFGEKTKELDLLSEIVFGDRVGKKGDEIITDFNNEAPVEGASPFARFYRTLLNLCKNS
ncbi:MAG: hypothetical protein J6A69_01750 [Clostridia bacterium]|nr:hypothetical protein [Clostridia bacterium]